MNKTNEAKEVEELAIKLFGITAIYSGSVYDNWKQCKDMDYYRLKAKDLIDEGYLKSPSAGLVALDKTKIGEFLASFGIRACQIPADNWVNFIFDTTEQFCSTFAIPAVTEESIIEECAKVAERQKEICGLSMSRRSTCDDIAFNIRNEAKAILERLKGK